MKEMVVTEEAAPAGGAFECGLVEFEEALALGGTIVSEKASHPPLRSVLLAQPEDGLHAFVMRATDIVATWVEVGSNRGDATASGDPLLVDYASLKQVLKAGVDSIKIAERRRLRVRIEGTGPLTARLTVGTFRGAVECFEAEGYPWPSPAALVKMADVAREDLATAAKTAARVAKAHRDNAVVSCVSLTVTPGLLRVMGTDSERLVTRTLPAETPEGFQGEQHRIVEGKSLAAMLKLNRGARVAVAAQEGGGVSITCGNVRLTSTLLDEHYPLAEAERVLAVLPVAAASTSARALLGEVKVARAIAETLTDGDCVELFVGREGVRVLPVLAERSREVEAPLVFARYEGPAGGVRRIFSGKLLEEALVAFGDAGVGLWLQRPCAGLVLAQAGCPASDASGARYLVTVATTAAVKADGRLKRAEFGAATAAGLDPKEDWPVARAALEGAARDAAAPLRDAGGRVTGRAVLAACRVMYAGFDQLDANVRVLGVSETLGLLADGARLSTDPLG